MINRLFIKNYALIEKADLEFKQGFTVITGETGAGKSILLGAIGLILGERADYSALKNKESKCIIESEFSLTENHLKDFFLQNDLDFDKNTIVRREISPSGKSRAFINDTPVNLVLLKEFGSKLINIHSQNQTHQLKDETFIIELIDHFIEDKSLLESFSDNLIKLKKLKTEYNHLLAESQKLKSDADYNRFQYDEIKSLNLENIDLDKLKQEVEFSQNQEQISEVIGTSLSLLESEESGVLDRMRKIKNQLSSISTISADFEELYSRFNSNIIELEDLSIELNNILENKDLNSSSESKVQLFDEINRLLQKHFLSDLNDLIALEKELSEKIDFADNSEEKLSELAQEIDSIEVALKQTGQLIHEARKRISKELENEIKRLLDDLVLPNAQVQFEVSKTEDFRISGMDKVRFLFNANLGGELTEISKSASGGETSRLMLAVQYLLSTKKSLATLIFDEIDTGISGEIASKIGYLLNEISQNIQVISITHLPQVASKGQQHFKVYKEDKEGMTRTYIEQLSNEGRIQEIAKMLSGENISEASIENAKSLLTFQ